MFSREQLRESVRARRIGAHTRRFFLRASVHILPCFVLTVLLAPIPPKCLAATPDNGDAAPARANSTGEVRPAISPDAEARLASTGAGASIAESGQALALTPRYPAPAFGDPPGSFLQSDYNAMNPVRPNRCMLFNDGLCRAIRNKSVITLATIQTGALISDGITTRQYLSRGYVEVDPITKIFLGRKPTWGRMAPLGAVQVIAGMWIAERVATSRHPWVRRLWWLPQMLGTAGNAAATANNVMLR